MIKKLSAFLIIIYIITGVFNFLPAFATRDFSVRDIQISMTTKNKGDIIYGKNVTWQLCINNTDADAKVLVVAAEVLDFEGEKVWDTEFNLTIPENTNYVHGITPSIDKYGTYKMNVKVSGEFGTIERSGSFACIKESVGFNDFFGVQTHFIWPSLDCPEYNLPLVSDSGFGVVRDHIEWYQVDTDAENGIPANVINYVDKIHASGQKLIMVIGNSNPAYDNGGLPVTEDALNAFEKFCGYVAERLKGKVYAYEIWNEPDYFDAFTNGIANTGTEYCKVLETAHNAIDAVDKEALILGGSLTAIGYTSFGSDNAALNYMQEMLGAGAAKYMDAFSFHPYSNTGYYVDEYTSRPSRCSENQIMLARDTLDEYGATDMPIWITELGASSYVDDNSDEDNMDEGYTEIEQAVNLQRMMVISKAEPSVMGMSVYNHREKGTNPNNFEHNFGLVNSDYTAKPVYVGVSFLNSFLMNAGIKEKTADGRYHFTDTDDESDIFTLWAKEDQIFTLSIEENDGGDVSFNGDVLTYPSTHTVVVYDMFGNEMSGSSITVGEKPVFIKCTPRYKAPTINLNNGHVTVSGRISDEKRCATVVAFKNIFAKREVVYIKQIYAENSSEYKAEFDLSGADLYEVCVYDGLLTADTLNNSDYDIDVELYNGNQKTENFEGVKNGDSITVVLSAKDSLFKMENLSVYSVVSDIDKVVLYASKSDLQWDEDKTGEVRITYTVSDTKNVDEFKLMLWNSINSPIIKPIKIK